MKKILFFIFINLLFAQNLYFHIFTLKLNYKEYFNGKTIDKDYSKIGKLKGIGISYSNNYNYLLYSLNFNYAFGTSNYKGYTWDGSPISVTQKGIHIYEINSQVGIKNLFLTIGYRNWQRGKSNFEGDYNEIYYWKYIGIIYKYPFIFKQIAFIPQFSYLKAINPKLKIKLGNKPTISLGNTYGKTLILPFFIKEENFIFNFYYKFEYWHVNPSNTYLITINNNTYEIFEPESKTKNQYFGIGIIKKF